MIRDGSTFLPKLDRRHVEDGLAQLHDLRHARRRREPDGFGLPSFCVHQGQHDLVTATAAIAFHDDITGHFGWSFLGERGRGGASNQPGGQKVRKSRTPHQAAAATSLSVGSSIAVREPTVQFDFQYLSLWDRVLTELPTVYRLERTKTLSFGLAGALYKYASCAGLALFPPQHRSSKKISSYNLVPQSRGECVEEKEAAVAAAA
jgi:hypothetical protein